MPTRLHLPTVCYSRNPRRLIKSAWSHPGLTVRLPQVLWWLDASQRAHLNVGQRRHNHKEPNWDIKSLRTVLTKLTKYKSNSYKNNDKGLFYFRQMQPKTLLRSLFSFHFLSSLKLCRVMTERGTMMRRRKRRRNNVLLNLRVG